MVAEIKQQCHHTSPKHSFCSLFRKLKARVSPRSLPSCPFPSIPEASSHRCSRAGDTLPPGATSTLRCAFSTNPHATQRAPLRDIYYLNNNLFIYFTSPQLMNRRKAPHLSTFGLSEQSCSSQTANETPHLQQHKDTAFVGRCTNGSHHRPQQPLTAAMASGQTQLTRSDAPHPSGDQPGAPKSNRHPTKQKRRTLEDAA